MRFYDLIQKTKNKIPLTKNEIDWMIQGIVNHDLPTEQTSAWLMAVCLQSLTVEEIQWLTFAMRDSGDKMELSEIEGCKLDKHSSGGVGDKTSLIIAPILASLGAKMPKMSGRGLGHTGGTIDKLESVGCNTTLSYDKFIEIVNQNGWSIIAQTENLVPADKILYAMRDLTATVNSIPLICSSIMSKKLALGSNGILLDVKLGSGAFMKSEKDAKELASLMVAVGKMAGKNCAAAITNMDAPLGNMIGNSLEVQEVVDILKGKKGELTDLCVALSSELYQMYAHESAEIAEKKVRNALDNGSAFDAFERTIFAQGGNLDLLNQKAKYKIDFTVKTSGVLSHIDSEKFGIAACMLGAGRTQKGQSIDFSAGIELHASLGDSLSAGDTLCTLYSSSISDFSEIQNLISSAISIDTSYQAKPMIFDIIR